MASRLGVTVGTLRRWDRDGKLTPALRTVGGHRRYDTAPRPMVSGGTVCYARVSCSDQKDDLKRQEQRLSAHAEASGWTGVTTISDLGSGMNCRKKGLLRLPGMVLRGEVGRLVIGNKDRLMRFGAEIIFWLCRAKGVQVIVLDAPKDASFGTDLASDVLEIITVFSSRLYGAMSHAHRKAAVSV